MTRIFKKSEETEQNQLQNDYHEFLLISSLHASKQPDFLSSNNICTLFDATRWGMTL
jgi:hypothetical protein